MRPYDEGVDLRVGMRMKAERNSRCDDENGEAKGLDRGWTGTCHQGS